MSYGISADGIAAALSILQPHPEITTGFYALASGNIHRLAVPQGAVRWSLFDGWLKQLGEAQWVDITIDQIEYYENPYYQNRSVYDKVTAENVDFPAIMLSGWYDIMQNCTIQLFNDFKAAIDVPETPRVLFVGPFGHC